MTTLTAINRVIITHTLSWFIFMIWILPGLRKCSVVPNVTMMRKTVGNKPQLSLLLVLRSKMKHQLRFYSLQIAKLGQKPVSIIYYLGYDPALSCPPCKLGYKITLLLNNRSSNCFSVLRYFVSKDSRDHKVSLCVCVCVTKDN